MLSEAQLELSNSEKTNQQIINNTIVNLENLLKCLSSTYSLTPESRKQALGSAISAAIAAALTTTGIIAFIGLLYSALNGYPSDTEYTTYVTPCSDDPTQLCTESERVLINPPLIGASILMAIFVTLGCIRTGYYVNQNVKNLLCNELEKESFFAEDKEEIMAIIDDVFQWIKDNDVYFNEKLITDFSMPHRLNNEITVKNTIDFIAQIKTWCVKLEKKLKVTPILEESNQPLTKHLLSQSPSSFFSASHLLSSRTTINSESTLLINDDVDNVVYSV